MSNYFTNKIQRKAKEKGHHVWGRSLYQNFPKNSRVSMFRHVGIVHNAKKEDIWAFFNVLGGQTIFGKKEDVW